MDLERRIYVTSNPHVATIDTVLGVDETSYDPTRIWPGPAVKPMGKDHPEAWHRRYEHGRMFVTMLGHNAEMYWDDRRLRDLPGGIYWAASGFGERR